MGTLLLETKILGYEGDPAASNPTQLFINWFSALTRVPVNTGGNLPLTLAAGETRTVFDQSRTLTVDGSTQLALSLTTLSSVRYRLAWTGTGAAPGFRTARTLVLSGGTVTLTLAANLTATLVSSLGSVFGAVQRGDNVFIPGVSTGDTGPFDPLNEGTWVVLSASATSLTIGRPTGTVFSGLTQAGVVVASNSQVQAFSSAGVQPGDAVALVANFLPDTLGTYTVFAVTASRVDFESVQPLPDQTVVPGVGGVQAYDAPKLWVRVESDQEVFVQVNGDTGAFQRIEPIAPGLVGWYDRVGTHFSLSVTNLSSAPAKLRVISVE